MLKVMKKRKKKNHDDDMERLSEVIQLIFSGANDPKLPDFVKKLPALFRRMFVHVFNKVFQSGKNLPQKEREQSAFRQARGVVNERMAATERILNGDFKFQEEPGSEQVIVTTGKGGSDDHVHEAVVSMEDGSGKTNEVHGHSHTIGNFRVMEVEGHTHSLPSSLRLIEYLKVDLSSDSPYYFKDVPVGVVNELRVELESSALSDVAVPEEDFKVFLSELVGECLDITCGRFVDFFDDYLHLILAETKREAGRDWPSSAFAFVPDSSKPSTWKLRIKELVNGTPQVTKAQLGRAAAAFSPGGFRGNKVSIPSSDVARVKAKLRSAYRALGVSQDEVPASLKASESALLMDYSGDGTVLAVWGRQGLGNVFVYPLKLSSVDLQVVDGNSDQFVARNVQILRTGNFVHSLYGKFNITVETLKQMVKNFTEGLRKVVVDYGHASSLEGHADPDVTKAAGWVKALKVVGNKLFAEVTFTKRAAEFIRSGEYQFTSPEFTLKYESRESPKRNLGALLFAVALTNRPFVEGMEPVRFSEVSNLEGGVNVRKVSEMIGLTDEQFAALTPEEKEEKVAAMLDSALSKVAQLEVKPGDEKSGSGDVKVKVEDEKKEDEKGDEVGVGVDTAVAVSASEVASLRVDNVKSNEKVLALTDELALLKTQLRHKDLNVQLDGLINQGKLLPKEREWAFKLSETAPALFKEFVDGAQQKVSMTSVGSSDYGPASDGKKKTAQEIASELTASRAVELGFKLSEIDPMQLDLIQRGIFAENPDLKMRVAEEILHPVAS